MKKSNQEAHPLSKNSRGQNWLEYRKKQASKRLTNYRVKDKTSCKLISETHFLEARD